LALARTGRPSGEAVRTPWRAATVPDTVAEAHAVERPLGPFPPDPAGQARVHQGCHHVLEDGLPRQEVELLEDEADLAVPHTG
jgi:hypothetical protein